MNTPLDFLYFMPGNWFEIKNIIADKTYPHDMDSFREEIISQVTERENKLDFIDIEFSKKYPKYKIEDIIFYCDETKFRKMINKFTSEQRHPIITFHGTTNYETVESILENGYIIPGITKSDIQIKKTHGSIYGAGVYSSPHFSKAIYYTSVDKEKYVYVLVNIVFLGKMKMIAPKENFTNNKPINNKYTNGIDTLIVFGLEQLISANPDNVVPVAVLKISI